MLSGHSGVGKIYIASGLCSDAIDKGYKAYFRTMDEILTTLKLKDITPSAKREYKCLCESDVIVIDDLMNITVDHDEVLANALLDRLLYKCELIQLSGASYWMKNRKRIFAATPYPKMNKIV